MSSIFIVFWRPPNSKNPLMVMAFPERHQAEAYIQQAVAADRNTYTWETLYYRSMDVWETYPN